MRLEFEPKSGAILKDLLFSEALMVKVFLGIGIIIKNFAISVPIIFIELLSEMKHLLSRFGVTQQLYRLYPFLEPFLLLSPLPNHLIWLLQ